MLKILILIKKVVSDVISETTFLLKSNFLFKMKGQGTVNRPPYIMPPAHEWAFIFY
jgi:hypothetical protein